MVRELSWLLPSCRDALSISGLFSPSIAVAVFCSRLYQVFTPSHHWGSSVTFQLSFLRRSLHGPGRPQEHTATPQYPAIKVRWAGTSVLSSFIFSLQKKKKFEEATEFIKNLKTVEEKQYQINRPKYYGWYSHQLSQVSALKCRL